MATFGHLVIGAVAGRAYETRATLRDLATRMGVLAFASVLPDGDFFLFHHAPVQTVFAHRGVTHSAVVALACGALFGLATGIVSPTGRRLDVAVKWGAFFAIAMATHGLIDMLGSRGSPVAYFWPIWPARLTLPVRPLPVAAFSSLLRFVYTEGLEVLVFAPLLLWALYPRKKSA